LRHRLATVLDVKVRTAPCHAATMPVALVPNCAATRFLRLHFDGFGPATIERPSPELWAGIPERFDAPEAVRVHLNNLDHAAVAQWRAGQACCCRAACSRRAMRRISAWWT
jgi:fumarate hydratase, class I